MVFALIWYLMKLIEWVSSRKYVKSLNRFDLIGKHWCGLQHGRKKLRISLKNSSRIMLRKMLARYNLQRIIIFYKLLTFVRITRKKTSNRRFINILLSIVYSRRRFFLNFLADSAHFIPKWLRKTDSIWKIWQNQKINVMNKINKINQKLNVFYICFIHSNKKN